MSAQHLSIILLRAAGAALLTCFAVEASAAAPMIRRTRRADQQRPPAAAATTPAPVPSGIGAARRRLYRRPRLDAGTSTANRDAPVEPAPPDIGPLSSIADAAGNAAAGNAEATNASADGAADGASSGDGYQTGINVSGRVGMVRRSLRFHQDVYDRLRTLDTNLYIYRVDAAVYPTFRSVALDGRVGLIAGYEGALTSHVRDGDFNARFPTSHSELFGGLRVRRPVHGHLLGFDLTLGRLASGLDDGPARAGTPDVRYGGARASLDLALRLGRVRTTFAAAFRLPLRYGEIGEAEWFPRLGGYGVDAGIGAAYPLSDAVSLDVAATLRRFVLEMNSEPEDGSAGISEVAGGAVDSFIGFYAGLSVVL